jgi:hypothetical protein
MIALFFPGDCDFKMREKEDIINERGLAGENLLRT